MNKNLSFRGDAVKRRGKYRNQYCNKNNKKHMQVEKKEQRNQIQWKIIIMNMIPSYYEAHELTSCFAELNRKSSRRLVIVAEGQEVLDVRGETLTG